MNPCAQFPLNDVTPSDVWDAMEAQVFEVTDGVRQACTYVVLDSVVYDLAPCWGGGLTSIAVADLDHDAEPELYFSYVWGSGISRTQFGAFLQNGPRWEAVEADSTFFLTGLVLRTSELDTVDVYLASQSYKPGSLGLYGDTRWKPVKNVGQLYLERTPGRPVLRVKIPGFRAGRRCD
jgi:hypothetical protein